MKALAVSRSIQIARQSYGACADLDEVLDSDIEAKVIRYLLRKCLEKVQTFTPRNDILFVCLIL